MLRTLRIIFASVIFALVTSLFLDFSGTVHEKIGFLAKIQFLPALLAANLLVVIGLLLVTLLFGRIYCSVLCPLGILQDIVSTVASRLNKNRFQYTRALTAVRVSTLVVFIGALAAGIGSIVALLAPYSAYGRIATNLFAPIYKLGNNVLAAHAERTGSYAFHTVDLWIPGVTTFIIAIATLILLMVLAWRNGRTYCNAICPVGTILGALSKFSLLHPYINVAKCNGCTRCARNCKASCINPAEHAIDLTRCVTCFDCLSACKQGAISYTWRRHVAAKNTTPEVKTNEPDGVTRHAFLSSISGAAAAAAVTKIVPREGDGGFADLIYKKDPTRTMPLKPAGAQGLANVTHHCTGCQLCVNVCPSRVLCPSSDPKTAMQPEMSYKHGYCRPECVKCSAVCPTGAIQHIDVAEKSSIQIGHAVWHKERCIAATEDVTCDNCARHCPTKAITMIPRDSSDATSPKIPMVNIEKCIGCGACEYLCPVSPLSALTVEGHLNHRII